MSLQETRFSERTSPGPSIERRRVYRTCLSLHSRAAPIARSPFEGINGGVREKRRERLKKDTEREANLKGEREREKVMKCMMSFYTMTLQIDIFLNLEFS